MANCSIPNSNPVSGRISTKSLRRSRKQSKSAAPFHALRLTGVADSNLVEAFNSQRSTPNPQLSIPKIGLRTLDIGCWEFSFSRRAKGAWWSSRSSKPSSSRKCRGRFDSYPLRENHRSRAIRNPQFAIRNLRGGEPHVA
jgi:hypothetical protein